MTREEAIKIIDCYDIGFYDLSGAKIPADKLADAFDMAIEALEQEPKRGKWVEDGCYPYYVCNKCGQMCGTQSNGVEIEPLFTNFCPNCGSPMEVESDTE